MACFGHQRMMMLVLLCRSFKCRHCRQVRGLYTEMSSMLKMIMVCMTACQKFSGKRQERMKSKRGERP